LLLRIYSKVSVRVRDSVRVRNSVSVRAGVMIVIITLTLTMTMMILIVIIIMIIIITLTLTLIGRVLTNWCMMSAPGHVFLKAAMDSFTKLVRLGLKSGLG
jgi:hypothetical protein